MCVYVYVCVCVCVCAAAEGWGKVSYVKSPIHKGSTGERRKKAYATLLRGYYARNITGDCMWCKNLALHKVF
jgi:hypothetical protein